MTGGKTLVIGTTIHGHDSAVFVVDMEEKNVFAMPTERLTRYKHDASFAIPPLARYLSYSGTNPASVSRVVCALSFKDFEKEGFAERHYEVELAFRKHFGAVYKKDVDTARTRFDNKPYVEKFLWLLQGPYGWSILFDKFLILLGMRRPIPLNEFVRRHLQKFFPNAAIEMAYYEHEYCHIASSYIAAPFDEALLFSFDGWGDGCFSHLYTASQGMLTKLASSPATPMQEQYNLGTEQEPVLMYPSVGGVYSYFTGLLGFTPISDEGKVEALAAYAKPHEAFVEELVDMIILDDVALTMTLDVKKALACIGVERFRERQEEYGKEVMAASVQAFLERITFSYLSAAVKKTGMSAIALSGGVSANVINNLMIYEHITPNIFVTPAMADDGAGQGAAYAYLLDHGYTRDDLAYLRASMPYYGTSYSREAVREVLEQYKSIVFKDLGDTWPETVGDLIAEGKIGAIFHGRMEWGPRALGNRSILADPSRKDFRDRINLHIKRRPAFQPFCPSILAEEKDRLFESAYLNKHMTCAFRLKKEFWDVLPSAIHIDGTARTQFVEEADNPQYYRILRRVKERTGFGVVINTSFNKHGRTIVESPNDAILDFLDTDMDYLAIEGFLVTRTS